MKPEDLFGVLVRLCGILFIIFGIGDLLIAAARALGVHLSPYHTWQDGMIGGSFWLLAGLVLFYGAGRLADAAYARGQ